MGRQWLQKNREINANRRAKIVTKLVRDITVAAKSGVPDPVMNARLHVAVEAARKYSVANDTITRAIKKGSGQGGESVDFELVTYEGMAPFKVPVIIECMTDNRNRTAPDIRSLFKDGQFGAKVMFLFEHVGIVEATHATAGLDTEAAAIEAGAQNVEPLEQAPDEGTGARFFTDRQDLDAVTQALRAAGWSVTLSEMGYVPKDRVQLLPEQRQRVEEFLSAIDDHDDCHRIYTALP
ncbi:MAG TPA: YebC/PmpR family DNA-binding transcriptional regulator [Planctomycetota bacterium]|nr:YebC/PmpR family DNA-binding transcriptional regulator [Planctomycetota bacterium]